MANASALRRHIYPSPTFSAWLYLRGINRSLQIDGAIRNSSAAYNLPKCAWCHQEGRLRNWFLEQVHKLQRYYIRSVIRKHRADLSFVTLINTECSDLLRVNNGMCLSLVGIPFICIATLCPAPFYFIPSLKTRCEVTHIKSFACVCASPRHRRTTHEIKKKSVGKAADVNVLFARLCCSFHNFPRTCS